MGMKRIASEAPHFVSYWDALKIDSELFFSKFLETPSRMTAYKASFRMDTLR